MANESTVVDWEGLIYYDGKIKEHIDSLAVKYLKVGGILASPQGLPAPSVNNLNYIYKINNSFITTESFQNPYKIYADGAWVQCTDVNGDGSKFLYTIFDQTEAGDNIDVDLSNYYTKEQVDTLLDEHIPEEPDLSNYYTKPEVDVEFAKLNTTVQVNATLLNEKTKDIDRHEGLLAVHEKRIDIVSAKVQNKAEEGHTHCVKDIVDLPDFDTFVTEQELTIKDYANKEFVKQQILEAELSDKDADLSLFYTKTETDAKISDAIRSIEIPDVSEFIKEIPSEYITEAELEGKKYLTQSSLETYSTIDYVQEEKSNIIAYVDGVASGFPTKVGELENDKGYLTEQNIAHLATNDDLQVVQNQSANNEVKIFQIADELVNITSQLDNIPNEYATKKELDEAIASIEHPTVDLEGYATEEYVDNKVAEIVVPTKVSELENDAGYVTKSIFVHDVQTLSADAYFTNDFTDYLNCETDKVLVIKCGNSVYDAIEVHSTFPDTYILSFLRSSNELVKITLTINEDYGTSNAFKWRCEPHIVSKLASEQFVKDSIDAINIPETDLSNYYNKTETETLVNEAVNGIVIPDTSKFITMDDVDAKGYLTEHQSISHLATKEELNEAIKSIPEVDLTGYATETYVNTAISNIPETDLSDYFDKEGTQAAIDAAINGINIPEAELYKVDYNSPDFNAAVEAYNSGKVLVLINAAPDVNSYAIMNYVKSDYITFTKFLMSRSQTYGAFNTYYLRSDNQWEVSKEVKLNKVEGTNIPTTEGKKLEALTIGKETFTLDSYASKAYVANAIAEAELADKDVDLSGLATTDELKAVESKIPTELSKLTNDVGFITINDVPETNLDGYVKEEDIKDLASVQYVAEEIGKIDIPDISNLITMNDVEAKGYLTAKDIDDKADKSELNSYATKNDLEAVTTKTEALDAITAKERYEVVKVPGLEVTYRDDEIRVNTQHITLTHQDVGEGGNSNEYYIGIKIYAPENATHIKQIITSAPGNFGDKEIVPFEASDIDSYGRKYSNAWIKCAVYNDSTGTWLNYGMNSTPDKCLGYYYSVEWYDATGAVIENDSVHVIFTNDTCHYSSISDAVNRKFTDVENKIPTLTNYATQEWVNNQGFIKEVPSEFVTETELQTKGYLTSSDIADKADKSELDSYATQEWVNNKGYLTEHQDLTDYAKKSDIPTVPTDVSAFNNDAGYLTEHQDLSAYAKKADIPDVTDFVNTTTLNEALVSKANNVLFTEDMRVNTSVGGFSVNESLQNMTIADILTKLLDLTLYVPPVIDEDLPEGTPDNVVEIVANKKPVYALDESGNIIPTTDSENFYRQLTIEEAKVDNQQESFFYQIVTEGQLKESGYHVTTPYQENNYLTVLIPESITSFSVKVYDTGASDWSVPTWKLEKNDNYNVEGYVSYTVPAQYEILSGIAIRIVIE